jgi:hypothetical protein
MEFHNYSSPVAQEIQQYEINNEAPGSDSFATSP